MCTLRACCARNAADWPAEFPPPTINNLVAFADLRFDMRRAVIHAFAFELLQIFQARLVVLRAGGDNDGSRG
jgi:hypothetical protein